MVHVHAKHDRTAYTSAVDVKGRCYIDSEKLCSKQAGVTEFSKECCQDLETHCSMDLSRQTRD